jgi:hypothetical protein
MDQHSDPPIVTFLLRCNSDVTCLLSGTEIKAILAYHVTKPGLKTSIIFDLWVWAIALHGRDTHPFWQLTIR